jgi:16S rRNA (guanine527-N7)-methyltransferase
MFHVKHLGLFLILRCPTPPARIGVWGERDVSRETSPGLTCFRRRGNAAVMVRLSPMTQEEFAAIADVSRETSERLQRFADLLAKWQRKINLVSAESLGDVWRRHMLDSAQLLKLLPPWTISLADIGSGAGFPGLALAILGVPDVHLIESDERKCAFLAEAARAAGCNPTIHRKRAEEISGLQVDVVTARGCAPLPKLLGYAEPLLGAKSICLFLKGGRVEEELTEAAKTWRMVTERFPSLSDPSGTILRISQVARERL